MKIMAYLFFIFQAFVLFLGYKSGVISNNISGLFFFYGVPGFLASICFFVILFLPTTIGCKFLKQHKRNTLTITKKMLEENPQLEYWTCAKCKSRNYMDKKTCPVCGITKQFSDDQKK